MKICAIINILCAFICGFYCSFKKFYNSMTSLEELGFHLIVFLILNIILFLIFRAFKNSDNEVLTKNEISKWWIIQFVSYIVSIFISYIFYML